MFVPIKINTSLFRAAAVMNEYLLFNHVKYYNRRGNVEAQRYNALMKMIENKDRRKNWHLNIVSDKPKVRIFDKIHKPYRRRGVLNSLFIKNITDVISTGDIAPELKNYGIEISGVRVSPCYKILNVFWQVPVSHCGSSEDIAKILTIASPKIRAELISRNVLGRVPLIFFLRDSINEKIASFEKAMENLDVGPNSDSSIVVDDSFMKDIFSFKAAKVKQKKNDLYISDDTKEELSNSDIDDTKEEYPALSEKPVLKCDIFGLDHEQMMGKVIALKKKKEPPMKTALISPESVNDDDDLFDKIPGVRFEADSSRNKILKQFQIERKILMKKKKRENLQVDNCQIHENHNIEDIDDNEVNSYEEDFIEEETTEDSHY